MNEAIMNNASRQNSSTRHALALTLSLSLALSACSSPTSTLGTGPNGNFDENGLSSTPETEMEFSSDAETAAQQTGFGGLRTFGAATTGESDATEAQVDSAGNVYVTGTTSAAFGGQGFNGGTDAYLAKFGSTGDLKWVRLIGTTGNERGLKVVPSPNGNVFVAGVTDGALYGSSLDAAASTQRNDNFLTKFDTNGKRLWGKQFGSNGPDSVSDMRVDANGNAIVSGVVQNTLLGVRGATGKGAFVVFAGPQGALANPRFYNTGSDRVEFVKLDRSLNVYVNSTTIVQASQDAIFTVFVDNMTRFSAGGTQQYRLSGLEHRYNSSWIYSSDSNGISYLFTTGGGIFTNFQRFDNGLETWSAATVRANGFVVAAQSLSNTDSYVVGEAGLARVGAGGIVLKTVRFPADPNNNLSTYAKGFNLDRSGNIFVVGYQTSRDANGNALRQPFVVKYDANFMLQ
jgi:hypothetical protein